MLVALSKSKITKLSAIIVQATPFPQSPARLERKLHSGQV